MMLMLSPGRSSMHVAGAEQEAFYGLRLVLRRRPGVPPLGRGDRAHRQARVLRQAHGVDRTGRRARRQHERWRRQAGVGRQAGAG
eukprot:6768482-Prymnesium_polylepis.1